MPNRIREILLVSSEYDAFVMEEDGRLGERVTSRYTELSLTRPPRITHASTGAKAIRLLDARPFDLVITVMQLEDVGVNAFGRMVKELFPQVPVVLLVFGELDLDGCPGGLDDEVVDHVLLWNGDPQVIVGAIKLIEDAANAEHDCREGGVYVVVVVEDSVRDLTRLVGLLYTEIVTQSRSLIADGLNELQKAERMRARPKVLHARSYEDAVALCDRYRGNLMAVISDVRFPRAGALDGDAGLALAEHLRQDAPGVPVLLLSSGSHNAARARAAGIPWIHKLANDLPKRTRRFMRETLGFGPFVFRTDDGTEVARAPDVFAMERVLETVPGPSLRYHALRHDFSRWLKARGMFDVAELLRPRQVTEFDDIDSIRAYLVDVLRTARRQVQHMLITDFDGNPAHLDSAFVRFGRGSTGGKGRGIAFLHQLIARHGLEHRFPGLRVCTPRTVVIGTGAYTAFLELDPPGEDLLQHGSEADLIDAFLRRPLPDSLSDDLRVAAATFDGPLAVRSSSLLEDSRFQSFAGIYATWMIPGNHPDPEVRHRELCHAVKAIYASVFMANARSYFRGTPYTPDAEQMAVVIQRMVGRRWGDRFYPHVAGVAQSRNYYPLDPQRAEDGIVMLALGLGQIVVGGGSTLRFSPACPQVLPQFSSAADQASRSQGRFYALDLTQPIVDFQRGCASNLGLFDLGAAEEDGSLRHVASVYSPQDDVIRDDLRRPGPRVVTFHDILKYRQVPLAEALAEILPLLRHAMGGEVELELALDLEAFGGPELHLLQVRHMLSSAATANGVNLDDLPAADVLLRTDVSLGHGTRADIADVVYVTALQPDAFATPGTARDVGRVTLALREAGRPFLLAGPGRWGTADPALGIPVEWAEIAGAGAIVELPFEGRDVAPSQGTHFFQNVTQRQIGYLTLTTRAVREAGGGRPKLLQWLDAQPAEQQVRDVRHVRLEAPLRVLLDGRSGEGAITTGGASRVQSAHYRTGP